VKYHDPIKINIPESCHEDWNAMTHNGCGRFCASCQKTVIDFTIMTDAEILNTLKNATNLCGRFLPDQLNRPIVLPQYRQSFPFRQKIVAGLLALQAFTVESFAQGKKKALTTVHHKKADASQKRIIKGRLLDFETQKPVAGLQLKLTATGYDTVYAQTDANGHFHFALPDSIMQVHLSAGDMLTKGIVAENIQLPHANLVIYRYPQHLLPEAGVTTRRQLTVIRTYESHTMGAITSIEEPHIVYRQTFWRRITKPFRRRHAY